MRSPPALGASFLTAFILVTFATFTRTSYGGVIDLSVPAAESVGVIPAGDGDWQISAAGCEEGDDKCELGFVFRGIGDRVVLCDFEKNNLKSFPVPLKGRNDIQVIPGVGSRPDDGMMTSDGTIYLLVDRHYNGALQPEPRYRVYFRAPTDTDWKSTQPFDLDVVQADGSALGYGAVSLATDGSALLYLTTRDANFALAIADDGLHAPGRVSGATDEPTRVAVTSNPDPIVIRAPDGSSDRPILKGMRFDVMGRDASGNLYSGLILKDTYAIARFSPEGVPLAAAALPALPVDRTMYAGRDILVLGDGRLLRFGVIGGKLWIHRFSF